MTQAIITVGLGYGDEGKGATVDFLCRQYNSKLVIRYSGGAQAAHNVVLPDGTHHCFSQFGAGTLAGAVTFLDRDVIIDPLGLRQEMIHLKKHCRITDPWQLLYIHPACLVTTGYHRAVNRTLETIRKKHNGHHGSCGLGIGETRRLWRDMGFAIQARDLSSSNNLLMDKIWHLRTVCRDYLLEQMGVAERDFVEWPENPYLVCKDLLSTWQLRDCIFDTPLGDRLSTTPVIFEGAQGFLLDEVHGQYPYTTWSTVTPRNAVELCQTHGVEYTILGVSRCYGTRHGEGGLHNTLPDIEIEEHNGESFQGTMRYGTLHVPSLQRAVKECSVDQLVVNHLDHFEKFGWRIFVGHEVDCGSDRRLLEILEESCGCGVALTSKGMTYRDREMVKDVLRVGTFSEEAAVDSNW